MFHSQIERRRFRRKKCCIFWDLLSFFNLNFHIFYISANPTTESNLWCIETEIIKMKNANNFTTNRSATIATRISNSIGGTITTHAHINQHLLYCIVDAIKTRHLSFFSDLLFLISIHFIFLLVFFFLFFSFF